MPDDADELDDNETNVKNSTATGKHELQPDTTVQPAGLCILISDLFEFGGEVKHQQSLSYLR